MAATSGLRGEVGRIVLVVAVDHLRESMRGVIAVRHDDRAKARVVLHPMVEAAPDIGRYAHLASLQHDGTDIAVFGLQVFEGRMQLHLDAVEDERNQRALGRADLQPVAAEGREVGTPERLLPAESRQTVDRREPYGLPRWQFLRDGG